MSTTTVVLFGDSGIDQKTGGSSGGGSVKDVEILFGSDEDGQNRETEQVGHFGNRVREARLRMFGHVQMMM